MTGNTKPGGGNKPQPYIPSGNGSKSGQYTSNNSAPAIVLIKCRKKNSYGKHNFCNSQLVGTVVSHFSISEKMSIPIKGVANSVTKKIVGDYIVSERYYNDKGNPYLDIDYTNHGNPKTHPVVPHIHRWTENQDGKFIRGKWEAFL